MDYLIRFVQAYESFRKPELEALATQANVKVEILQYHPNTPFCVVRLHPLSPTSKTPDEIAADFISRSFLSKGIYELWAEGTDYDSIHDIVRRETQHLWAKHQYDAFKFTIDAYCGKLSASEQTEIVRSFSYLGFKGPVSMKNPKVHFVVFEEWEDTAMPLSTAQRHLNSLSLDSEVTTEPRGRLRILFCRHVGSTRRNLAGKHDLKKRPYISTTSMDALLALVTANLALAGPGKLFLDPFVGTGGFMVAASELGALSLGSDIDGRSFRGKGKGMDKGVCANFAKYGIQDLFGDCITSDLTNSPFRVVPTTKPSDSGIGQGDREARWLDAIITDPPYGVREGLKVLGVRQSKVTHADRLARSGEKLDSKCIVGPGGAKSQQDPNHKIKTLEQEEEEEPVQIGPHLIDGVPSYLLPGYISPKRPYSFTSMMSDILSFAATTLIDGGRLAFWMPGADEDFNNRLGDRSVEGDVDREDNNTNHNGTQIKPQSPFPTHPSLQLKHVCTQSFNKWSRKLLVYERLSHPVLPSSSSSSYQAPPTTTVATEGTVEKENDNDNGNGNRITADDLNPFRKRYFQGFQ